MEKGKEVNRLGRGRENAISKLY